jgi:hypothetical protein
VTGGAFRAPPFLQIIKKVPQPAFTPSIPCRTGVAEAFARARPCLSDLAKNPEQDEHGKPHQVPIVVGIEEQESGCKDENSKRQDRFP